MRRIAAIAVAVAGLSLAVAPVAGADLNDDLRRVGSEVDQLRGQVSGVRSERTDLANLILDTGDRLDALVSDLETAEAALAVTDQAIAETEAALADLAGRISDREARVTQIEGDIGSIKADAVARAVELYMQGQPSATVVLFQIEDASRASIGIAYAARVQEVADRLIDQLESLSIEQTRQRDRLGREQAQLETEAEYLDFQREERLAAAGLVESRAAEVAAELDVQQAQLAELEHEIAHIEGEIAALQREEAQIKALIIQQANSGGTRPGVLLRPVPGGVSSGYGYRTHPIYGDRRLHTGWDMNAGCGAAIRAAESGTVIFSGWKGGYGNAIIIDHGGGMSTLYAHQSRLGLSYGASVGIGDTIGWIGSTGVSTACHLHFEVRINGDPVDPAQYL